MDMDIQYQSMLLRSILCQSLLPRNNTETTDLFSDAFELLNGTTGLTNISPYHFQSGATSSSTPLLLDLTDAASSVATGAQLLFSPVNASSAYGSIQRQQRPVILQRQNIAFFDQQTSGAKFESDSSEEQHQQNELKIEPESAPPYCRQMTMDSDLKNALLLRRLSQQSQIQNDSSTMLPAVILNNGSVGVQMPIAPAQSNNLLHGNNGNGIVSHQLQVHASALLAAATAMQKQHTANKAGSISTMAQSIALSTKSNPVVLSELLQQQIEEESTLHKANDSQQQQGSALLTELLNTELLTPPSTASSTSSLSNSGNNLPICSSSDLLTFLGSAFNSMVLQAKNASDPETISGAFVPPMTTCDGESRSLVRFFKRFFYIDISIFFNFFHPLT